MIGSDLLAALLAEPEKAAQVPPEDVPALLGDLARLRAMLWVRLNEGTKGLGLSPEGEDRLLKAAEAAQRLGMSKDWVYRNAHKLPFTVRPSPGQVRFSAHGIKKYIKQRRGK